ncbi:LytR/AlgR family response regulator transcription factor [Neisseria weaveri]|uniref:Sensory transduction protein lytR n=1 Tax=Neisseria weaveri TaxID=28091 RepID=A0A3S5B4X4_9NEIS|nr:LytTR family DNA-binding domain-containing protein [Neisseria weaveri]EGV36720.1 two-component system regulatory protein [Neisseria weaveri LMG 5135]EGV37864.1 two-component system regulatory protein [Neisseria weaveri ATCC 51223]SAY51866.1 Sensory transduction protein lytR [Neisseria weaveri]VEJ51288.1 Sensory transduction protein lytR [Neisseria weaveri]
MLSAIIVEDEVLAAERLRVLLDECNIVLLKVFHHAQPALDWLSMHEADIVFADIGLPEITGLELVERIKRIAKKQPEVIFTTAYEEHALRAFELAAVDYLLKPIKISRLQTALDRVREKKKELSDNFTHFKVFNRDRMIEIPWQQARYLLAEHKTVFLFTGDGQSYELPKTLVHWEEILGDKVIRVHRNTLVFRHTLDCLIRLDNDEDEGNATWAAQVLDISEPLAVSRRQLAAIRKILRAS